MGGGRRPGFNLTPSAQVGDGLGEGLPWTLPVTQPTSRALGIGVLRASSALGGPGGHSDAGAQPSWG